MITYDFTPERIVEGCVFCGRDDYEWDSGDGLAATAVECKTCGARYWFYRELGADLISGPSKPYERKEQPVKRKESLLSRVVAKVAAFLRTLGLSSEERFVLAEALESHIYWQLSDEQYRHGGEVFDVERPDEDVISDDPENQRQGLLCRKLIEKFGG